VLVPPELNASCDLVNSRNILLVCLVSLLAGETGKMHYDSSFTGTDSQELSYSAVDFVERLPYM
jgi:hypothetical protein